MPEISINYRTFVSRLEQVGSVSLLWTEIPIPLPRFRRELRREAKQAGIRVLTSSRDGSFIAWDPEFVVSPEALRSAMDALADLDSSQPTCPSDGVVLRDVPNGWVCATCGYEIQLSSPKEVPPPAPIKGIHGG